MFGAITETTAEVNLAFFGGGLGTPEIIIILVVLLLLFGSRLPSVMRSLGKSATEFKRGMNDIVEEEPPAPSTPTAPTVSVEPQKSEAAEDQSTEK